MSTGASPPGVTGEQQTARWVRRMFDQVAPRYDLLNHLLSFQTDRYWRWRTVRSLETILRNPDAVILDICCGSGDLTAALRRHAAGRVVGSDFSHSMLVAAGRKLWGGPGAHPIPLFESDALQLPLADASLDLATVAFGFRNLANYDAGLREMLRVLKPGGTAAILEFSQPSNPIMAALYGFYSRRVLPAIGGLVSGSREAYQYLPDSVRKFPGPDGLASAMRRAGFHEVRYRTMTAGVVALHTGRRQ